MNELEILAGITFIVAPIWVAYEVYTNFDAEYQRFLALREAECERHDQIMAGGAATEVGEIRKE